MWAKTTFWYAVMALTVVASAVAGPLATVNAPESENETVNTLAPSKAEKPTAQPSDLLPPTKSAELQQKQQPQSTGRPEDSSEVELVPVNSESAPGNPELVPVNPDMFDVMPSVNIEPDVPVSSDLPSTPVAGIADSPSTTPAAGTVSPNVAATIQPGAPSGQPGAPSGQPGAPSGQPGPAYGQPGPPAYGKKPKPYYPGGMQPVNFGPGFPNMPFFLEFFQPFQPFGQPGPVHQKQQPLPPFRHPQQPFGAAVDPFDPFSSDPAQRSPFHQLVEAYTNEFRTPNGIIVKPKRNVRHNTTSIPPIPLLMNIMLSAFRHEPTDMLETLDKMPTVPQATKGQDGSGKPVAKTTSKTEIIDGHVVQVNETTYSDGDDNHKTFYHFKEIQVLPETASKKIANENLVTITKDDSETQRVETNEIRRDQANAAVPSQERGDEVSKEMRKAEPVSLDEHYQTAAASYYSPYAPAYYGPRPPTTGQLVYYGRPPVGYGHPTPGPYGHPMPVPYGHPMFGPYEYQMHGGGGGGGPYGHQMHYEQQRPKPISLYGDTLVNDLLDASNQAAGVEVVLPPDVELIDANRKPQRGNQQQQLYYKNRRQRRASRLQQVFRAPSSV